LVEKREKEKSIEKFYSDEDKEKIKEDENELLEFI